MLAIILTVHHFMMEMHGHSRHTEVKKFFNAPEDFNSVLFLSQKRKLVHTVIEMWSENKTNVYWSFCIQHFARNDKPNNLIAIVCSLFCFSLDILLVVTHSTQ